MSATASAPTRQQRVYAALGLTRWQLRRADAVEPDIVEATLAALPAAADCVLVIPGGCTPRELDMLGRAVQAFGPMLARAARIEVHAGKLAQVPAAAAYLAFGTEQAHALGRELPAAALARAQVVLADAPAGLSGDGAAKRRLWNAMRALRRALRTGAEA
jgi:hypothetical protein